MAPAVLGHGPSASAQTPKTPKAPAPSFFVAASAAQTPKAANTPSLRSVQTPKSPKTPAPSFFISASAAQTPKASKTPKTPSAPAPSFFVTAALSTQAPQTQHASTGATVEQVRRHQAHPQTLATTGWGASSFQLDANAAGSSQGYPTLLNQLLLLAPQMPAPANSAASRQPALAVRPGQPAGLPVQSVQSATDALEGYRERQSHIESRQLPFHM